MCWAIFYDQKRSPNLQDTVMNINGECMRFRFYHTSNQLLSFRWSHTRSMELNAGSICWIHILKPSANRSPYIFTLVQKVKHMVYKIHPFKWSNTLQRLYKLFHLKMTCTSSTDEVRVKVFSFQKVTLFLRYKTFNRDVINLGFRLFEDFTDYCDWRRINRKKFCFDRTLQFCYTMT